MNNAENVLDQIRGWLSQGCLIKATSAKGDILKWKEDGTMIGGLTIEFPKEDVGGTVPGPGPLNSEMQFQTEQ